MELQAIMQKLEGVLPNECIKINEPMKRHTTFKIGGPARLYVTPRTTDQLAFLLKLCKDMQIPLFIIGKGSNLLVSDEGIEGVVIELAKDFATVKVEGNLIEASSGATLCEIAEVALEHSLTGFEFAHGIPGTLGGAVTMNAGAYDGEMKQVILEATLMDEDGSLFTLDKEALALGYRKSIIQTKGYVVISAKLMLGKGEKKLIQEKMSELKARREEKQPLEYGSAGSTFKRPEGYFAGKLIMDSGLRGYQLGDAMVSDKHCGFVINRENASFQDVKKLIEHIQKTVKINFGVDLETEIKIIE
jgi:UDP-N-acetylmuramate dehydrogenase